MEWLCQNQFLHLTIASSICCIYVWSKEERINSCYFCGGWFQQVRWMALPRIARDFTLVDILKPSRHLRNKIIFGVLKRTFDSKTRSLGLASLSSKNTLTLVFVQCQSFGKKNQRLSRSDDLILLVHPDPPHLDRVEEWKPIRHGAWTMCGGYP